MDDLAAMEVGQAVQHAFCDLPEDLFSSPTTELLDLTVDSIETSSRTVLHHNRYSTTRVVESAIVLAYGL